MRSPRLPPFGLSTFPRTTSSFSLVLQQIYDGDSPNADADDIGDQVDDTVRVSTSSVQLLGYWRMLETILPRLAEAFCSADMEH